MGPGGSGRFGGKGGRRRAGPGNGKGGLSKKTLNIVTNLKSHTVGVRSRQELEEVEEEKRLAEEERRFKENLRQKVCSVWPRVFCSCNLFLSPPSLVLLSLSTFVFVPLSLNPLVMYLVASAVKVPKSRCSKWRGSFL